jgi:hypothetical protein
MRGWYEVVTACLSVHHDVHEAAGLVTETESTGTRNDGFMSTDRRQVSARRRALPLQHFTCNDRFTARAEAYKLFSRHTGLRLLPVQ